MKRFAALFAPLSTSNAGQSALKLGALALTVLGLTAGLATNSPAAAQMILGESGLTLTATPLVSTDYLFRGISQTRNRPAVQGTIDLQHDSGFYIGAFGSNVTFPGSNARQELDLAAGYRFAVGDATFDLGGIYYTYPGYDAAPGSYDYNYFEALAKVSYTMAPFKLVGTAAYSPNFYFESGDGLYLEGGADLSLPAEFTMSGRFGHQWIERNTRYGAPDYSNWSIAASREVVAGITLTVGYYDTDLSKRECFAGAKLCDARAMVTLSKIF
jgi:uncharacterized protein (TIGR02001 family)